MKQLNSQFIPKMLLIEKEIIEEEKGEAHLSNPIFELWFKKEYL